MLPTTKPIYGCVSPPYWSEVWIVGSGPSVANFDWSRLHGKRILAINDAIFRFVDSLSRVSSFSLDNHWIRRHRDFLENLDCEKYLALPLETWPDCGGIAGVEYLQWAAGDGFHEDLRFVNTGCHSGYAALNVAYHKKASEIHLVGFDLDPSANSQYQYWAKNYDTTVSQINARGIQVLNHNPDSAITAFPRVN